MTCNNKCIHYPVCEQKNYDFANIEECPYYYDTPTVEPKKEIVPVCKVTFDKEQLQEIVDKKVAELVADCENCPFKKFSEEMVDKIAKVMIDNDIADFDEFAKRCGVSYLHQDSITKSDTQI